MQMTQLAIRLLLLTGVRTGELRLATPDQFDLEQGLWIIPVMSLKQRKMLTKKKRKRVTDIPPYIVPLPVQAIEIVRHMLDLFKPAQTYLFPGVKRITARMSENTVNRAIKRLGYDGRLTGHGIRATISTALNELGYPKVWVDAQLSHADPNRISATYNHAEYVEQRRLMMQDWADRLDLFEQNQVQIASTHLTIHLQGVPTIAGQKVTPLPALGQHAPIMLVAPNEQTMPAVGTGTQRLSAVQMPEYALPKISEVQRERLEVLDILKGPTTWSSRTMPSSRANRGGGLLTRSRPATYFQFSWATRGSGFRCGNSTCSSAAWCRRYSSVCTVALIHGISTTP